LDEARQRWGSLVVQDTRYYDADWVGKVHNWAPPLVEAARVLINQM
jgi:hypothetical protein